MTTHSIDDDGRSLRQLLGLVASIESGIVELVSFEQGVDMEFAIAPPEHGQPMQHDFMRRGETTVTFKVEHPERRRLCREWLANLQARWKAYAEQPDADPALLDQARQEGLLL